MAQRPSTPPSHHRPLLSRLSWQASLRAGHLRGNARARDARQPPHTAARRLEGNGPAVPACRARLANKKAALPGAVGVQDGHARKESRAGSVALRGHHLVEARSDASPARRVFSIPWLHAAIGLHATIVYIRFPQKGARALGRASAWAAFVVCSWLIRSAQQRESVGAARRTRVMCSTPSARLLSSVIVSSDRRLSWRTSRLV